MEKMYFIIRQMHAWNEKVSNYKFRSMVVGAEKFAGAQLAQNRDPRMTRVGYILRKYKLDEVPQLINILEER